jgi:hypothetical protein
MGRGNVKRIVFEGERLTNADVLNLAEEFLPTSHGRVVVLDLRTCRETTTAALASLILLRRRQIQTDGDLLLLGLTGKAHYLYELLRLAKVLPRRPCISPRRVRQRSFGRDESAGPPSQDPSDRSEAVA